MKNPYLQSRQVTMRYVVFATAVPFLIAKAVLVIIWFNTPEIFNQVPGHGWTVVGAGCTEVLDIVAAYYVTGGWYDLFRKPWAILLSASVNVALAVFLILLRILAAQSTPNSTNILFAALAALPLAAAILQLIASLKIYSRLKK